MRAWAKWSTTRSLTSLRRPHPWTESRSGVSRMSFSNPRPMFPPKWSQVMSGPLEIRYSISFKPLWVTTKKWRQSKCSARVEVTSSLQVKITVWMCTLFCSSSHSSIYTSPLDRYDIKNMKKMLQLQTRTHDGRTSRNNSFARAMLTVSLLVVRGVLNPIRKLITQKLQENRSTHGTQIEHRYGIHIKAMSLDPVDTIT